jgi:RES domain-containing protein
MKIRAWRLVAEKFAESAFSGEGAFKYGGRWNSAGVGVVYSAQSIALATLEILAGGVTISLLEKYAKIPVDFDESAVYSPMSLPEGWTAYPPGRKTRDIGDGWVREQKSLVLRVPSAVIREEFIYIINPQHPDAVKGLKIGAAEKFHFDSRLKHA